MPQLTTFTRMGTVDINTEIRLSQVDESKRPPIEILAMVRGYDDRLDLKWDAKYSTWGLYRRSELGPVVFCCTVGERLDGRILAALADQDTRSEGYDQRQWKRMEDARKAAKAAMREKQRLLREQLEEALAEYSLECAARKAQKVIEQHQENGG